MAAPGAGRKPPSVKGGTPTVSPLRRHSTVRPTRGRSGQPIPLLGLAPGADAVSTNPAGTSGTDPSSHYPLAVPFLLIRRDSRPYRLRGSPARSEGGLSSAEERNSSTVGRPPAPGAAKSIFTTCGI